MEKILSQWVPPSMATTLGFLMLVLFVVVGFLWMVHRAYGDRRVLLKAVPFVFLWLLITAGYVASGIMRENAFALIPFFASGAVVATGITLSKLGKRLATLPFGVLLGFQCFRFPLELILAEWGKTGTIPIQMTFSGHNYDIFSGLIGLGTLVFVALRGRDLSRGWAIFLNLVGSLLLIAVIVIVVLSSPLPIKQYSGPPILLGIYLPYAWIGPICVAGAFLFHLITWRRIITLSTEEGAH